MPRVVEITIPAERTEEIIRHLKAAPAVIGLRLQRGVSLQPAGDLVTVETTNQSLPELIRLLERDGVGKDSSSFTTNEPASVVVGKQAGAISGDISEATWEEMASTLNKQSHMSINGLLVMGLAGMIVSVGLATGSLLVVIGGKLIAPGFDVLARIGLGIATQSRNWLRGLKDAATGYIALIVGAIVMTEILRSLRESLLGGGALPDYWTIIKPTTLWSDGLGALVGAILIASNRTLLTAGVMIVMSLVQSAAVIGIGLGAGNLAVALKGFELWSINVGMVVVASFLVFGWKRLTVHRRKSLM